MSAIGLDGVTVTYGDVTAVDGVDLRVRDGELLVLVGPSGCGKTTLLRVIAGLEEPDAGDVLLGGRRVTDLPARKRDVSLVFQDFALFPHLTVRENVSFDLRMQNGDDVAERTRDVAGLLEIEELLDRSIDELSGGQKQRVALGRALATEPRAFLLDEPLANLDATLRDRMRTEIARLQDDLGITTVHVTHDQAEALTMGDRVAVMRDGRIVQAGTPEAVYRSPQSRFVAEFVGSPTMNLFDGRYDPAAETVAPAGREDWPVPLALDGDADEVTLGVRPERVVTATDRPKEGDWIETTVAFEEFHGADRYAYLDAPGIGEVVARVAAESTVASGDTLWVQFPADSVHCFDAETGERIEAETGTTVREERHP